MDMVEQLMETFFDSPLARFSGNPVLNKLPLVDIQETADGYLVEADLPGFDEKQIKVQVEGGKLTIESARDEEKKEEKEGAYLIRERRNVSFSRSFTLPENADTESVAATFKNGMLSLEIKKRTGNARRLVEIKAQ
jgi:HSP20 family molecular chaperone IbpA